MSMGKSDHIPTISISKELGTALAKKDKGTLTISYNNQAGPFMSDFSSWGPTPSLGIKPEIEQLPMQLGDVDRTYADITKAKRLLGYEPTIDFSEGVRRFVRWSQSRK